MNEQHISLDVAKESGTPQVVAIAQGDAAGTTIVADVYDNGAALDLTGKTARLVARLPDGLHYNRLSCTVSGSTATCVLGEDSLARVAGYTDCAYLEIQDGDAVVSTERFALDILRSALDGAEPGENWDSEIQRVIAQGDASIERVNAAIDSASVSDEDIDAVASGEDRSGSAKLSLSGLTRLWARIKDAFAAKSHTHATDDVTSGVLPVERGGTGSSTGRAPSATKLATARELRTDLGSTDAASFDGSANATPGVTGTLDVAHGGTGSTTAVDARTALGAASASDLSDLQDSVSQFVYNTVLFDGDADGSVTLSESCANFDYIDIMYECEDRSEGAIWGSKRVSSPNGKQVGLEVVIAIRQGGAGTYPNVIQLQTRNYRFDGKSLAPFSAAIMNYYSDGRMEFSGTSDRIHVRHVIGWKK